LYVVSDAFCAFKYDRASALRSAKALGRVSASLIDRRRPPKMDSL
jgi:hypothetical protein